MGFCRQEYWSRLPFPPPGNLPDPGIKPASPALAGRFFTCEPPGKLQRSLEGLLNHKESPPHRFLVSGVRVGSLSFSKNCPGLVEGSGPHFKDSAYQRGVKGWAGGPGESHLLHSPCRRRLATRLSCSRRRCRPRNLETLTTPQTGPRYLRDNQVIMLPLYLLLTHT